MKKTKIGNRFMLASAAAMAATRISNIAPREKLAASLAYGTSKSAWRHQHGAASAALKSENVKKTKNQWRKSW
jgi:hypothetical protein